MNKKNAYILLLIFFLSAIFFSCGKKVDTTKIKGTWQSTLGTVVIEDSTIHNPPNPQRHKYKLGNDTTLYIFFEMEDVIRVTEFTIEKLDDDSLVVNDNTITRYGRVK